MVNVDADHDRVFFIDRFLFHNFLGNDRLAWNCANLAVLSSKLEKGQRVPQNWGNMQHGIRYYSFYRYSVLYFYYCMQVMELDFATDAVSKFEDQHS